MRKILTFLAVVMITCTGAEEPDSSVSSSLVWRDTANSDGCYRVAFPESWVVSLIGADGDDVQALSPPEGAQDRHFENVVIWVEPLLEDYTPEQYYQQSVNNLKSRSRAFSLLDEGQRKVDGHSALWFHAKLQQGGVWGEILQVQVLHEGRVYIIDCTVEPGKMDEYRHIFNHIIDSFQIECF